MTKGHKNDSPKRQPSRGGTRMAETTVKKVKNASGQGSLLTGGGNGPSKSSAEDYAPVNQFGGNKQIRAATFFPGK